jgi:phosphomannomutase
MAILPCFKAYDIRGRFPDEINEELAYWIGQAYAARFAPRAIVLGHDIRLSGPGLTDALADGLMTAGVDVIHIGQCGTEEIYFAAAHLPVDGGIIVTASHNPADYNGMKLVRQGARPISGDSGLKDIERLASERLPLTAANRGQLTRLDNRAAYVDHLLGYVDVAGLKPLTLVVNPGNGGAGAVIDCLEERLPFRLIKLHHEPDGRFPNGVPNPLLPENRAVTAQAVRDHGADLGIAWDGDFDRCFLFDEKGGFVEGYYMVGLLAQAMLSRFPGAKVIHDPRLTWNTVELVREAGGVPVMSKTGHAFIKERMRAEDAVYGGEMSSHHYFKEFAYCDSGMIPWLLTCRILSRSGKPLSALLAGRMAAFPVSGEINSTVADPDAVISRVTERFAQGGRLDDTDGLSVEFDDYRFNLRLSNTEPVIRLNVESRGDRRLMEEKTAAILDAIRE